MKSHGFRMLAGITMGVLLLLGAVVSPTALGQTQDKKVVPAAARQTDLDKPIEWMQEAKRNYAVVKDYTCTLVTQERVKGKLLDPSYVNLKMRTEPFSVYMKWIGEGKFKGQEVVFTVAKNNNKMRVKSPLLPGNIWMNVDVNDKRVMEHSNHTILEAGLGNMIEQHLAQWEVERKVGKTQVMPITEHAYAGRKCYKVEMIRNEKDSRFYCHRSVIYVEKESKLPIRLENYDWPRQVGAAPELMEMFGYVNLQFNQNLKAADFDR